jgi:urease accessory protein
MNAHALPSLQRSTGLADVALSPQGRPMRLVQQGSAKAFLTAPGEVTFLNTSGGLAGGDLYRVRLALAKGARATATTQTAERAYRAPDAAAQVDIRLEVAAGAHLQWLPQETILFDGAALHRQTRVTLAAGASCLMAEMLVLGRAAMGETVARVDLRDRREVWRDGRPVWVDPLQVSDGTLAGAATLAGARAIATVALIQDGAERHLAPLRRVLDAPGVRAAASVLPGRLILRMMADRAQDLRRQCLRALSVLRDGATFPRVWQT